MRADKKLKTAPFVPADVRLFVHDAARFLSQRERQHVGDQVPARQLVVAAMNDIPTLNKMSAFFWRDYHFGTHSFIGHKDHDDLDRVIAPKRVELERLSIRFSQDEVEDLDQLSFALARPMAHATAALLHYAIRDDRVIQSALPGFVLRDPYSLKYGAPQWKAK